MVKIGITSSVPIEILIAAGFQPVDLNNVFINDNHPEHLINLAEKAGFPQNCCAWIKGIYGVCQEYGIDTVLCVTSGDCSNTLMLMEVFKLKGLKVYSFAYPEIPDRSLLQSALEKLANTFGTTLEAAENIRQKVAPCRSMANELDELTWKGNVVSGWENHYWLVSCSDFNMNYLEFNNRLNELLAQCKNRSQYPSDMLRLAYIGVPPVYSRDLYNFLERNGARVVFNELQSQFSMRKPCMSLIEQYSNYTYPYSILYRLEDILEKTEHRHISGIIHYVQAFCHRGIGDIIFRARINKPLLTIEGNNEFILSQHLRTRIEAFLDLLRKKEKVLSGIKKI